MRYNLLYLTSLLLAQVYGQCPMEGIIPKRHQDIHNYVIDNLDGGHFPFAIDKCTSTSALPTQTWYKYTCHHTNGTWSITKTEYSDAECTGEGEIITGWQEDMEGLEKFFECSAGNSYVQLELSAGNPCENSVTIYAGLGSCIVSTTIFGELEMFCNETTTLIHFFADSTQSTTFMPMSTTEMVMSTTDMNISETNLPVLNFSSSTTMPDETTELNLTMTTDIPQLNFTSTLISTLISSIFQTTLSSNLFSTTQTKTLCDDKNYCEVWVLPLSECSLASTSAFEDVEVYVKMIKCGVITEETSSTTSSTSVTETTKSASVPVPLVINGIFSLLFAMYWI
jgi:hypothetical protein